MCSGCIHTKEPSMFGAGVTVDLCAGGAQFVSCLVLLAILIDIFNVSQSFQCQDTTTNRIHLLPSVFMFIQHEVCVSVNLYFINITCSLSPNTKDSSVSKCDWTVRLNQGQGFLSSRMCFGWLWYPPNLLSNG